ncbi:MAG: SDR family oxidoreductase [bacterium]|nr:SDR family oxidoreductase [bacterium]
MRVYNKTILITGGAGGVGGALAQKCVSAGARVFSLDIRPPEAPIEGVTYYTVDITKSVAICKAIKKIPHPIHCLVNNAGVMRRGKIFETSEADWDFLFSINVKAPWLVTKCAQPFLARNATIVSVSSKHGVHLVADPAVYALTKATLLTLSKIIALTYPSYRMKVACFGPIDTALHHFGRDRAQLKQEKKEGKVCMPADAATMLFKLITLDKTQLLFNPGTCSYSFTD